MEIAEKNWFPRESLRLKKRGRGLSRVEREEKGRSKNSSNSEEKSTFPKTYPACCQGGKRGGDAITEKEEENPSSCQPTKGKTPT